MKDKFLAMTMGEHLEIKRGLSTKEIIRLNTDEWEVNCFVSGWDTYYLNLTELLTYFNGNFQEVENLILKLYDGYESEKDINK